MDGKTLAIAALVVTALLLGGIVASGFRQEQAAYAQNGIYSTYLLATARVREDSVNFVVVDTAKRRMVFYEYNPATKKLTPTRPGHNLVQEFQRKLP